MKDPDYARAEEFLTLILNKEAAEAVIGKFRRAEVVYFRADDVMRAAKITERVLTTGASEGPVLLLRNSNALMVVVGIDQVLKEAPFGRIACKIV